jgi:hypothetical protein
MVLTESSQLERAKMTEAARSERMHMRDTQTLSMHGQQKKNELKEHSERRREAELDKVLEHIEERNAERAVTAEKYVQKMGDN